MNFGLIALILAAVPDAPTALPGETVFAARFDADSDANYDGWPDGWTRRRGEGFPQYLAIEIADDPDQAGGRCLRIALDGGAATLLSPPIPIDPRCSYVFSGRIKTRQLAHDLVYYSLTFIDAERRQKETFESTPLTHAPDWLDIQIGPVRPSSPDVRFAVIGVHVAPSAEADLVGTAMFDDVRLTRLPYLRLETAQPHNLFHDPGDIAIDCSVAGLPDQELSVRLELLDVDGSVQDAAQLTFSPDAALDESREQSADAARPEAADRGGWQRAPTWRPRVSEPGYYQVRGTLLQHGTAVWQHTIELAVLLVGQRPNPTEFAWSLSDATTPLPPQQLVPLLALARVGWLKYQLPCTPSSTRDLAALADSLSAADIKMVGVLGPSAASGPAASDLPAPPVARDWFRDPAQWQSACDPLLNQLGMAVSHWQLGRDGDGSFAEDPQCVELVRGVREHLRRAGNCGRLGVAWPWDYPVRRGPEPPWDFLSRMESLPFTAGELEHYAASSDGTPPPWVALRPLSATQYPATTRAQDLVRRLVVAKRHGHPVIAIDDPVDDDCGLLSRQGTPTALFLPWCVTAELLGGAKYSGSLLLPNGSANCVFERNGTGVMVLWNDRTVTEMLYLGSSARQVDLWGRETAVPTTDLRGIPAQSIVAGPAPRFLVGLDLPLVLWQVHCRLEPVQLINGDGTLETLRLTAANTFPSPVEGRFVLRAPASWIVRGDGQPLRLAAQEQMTQDISVRLHPDADQGLERLEIEFDIAEDHAYQFRVYRDIQVGTGEIQLALDSWLDAAGQLRVEQRVTSTSATPISVNCYLQAPGRRRLRHQILDLLHGHACHTFVLPDGAALADQMLYLRVEEIGGTRQWNCRARATLSQASRPLRADPPPSAARGAGGG